jgi:hypothetical protein
MQRRSEFRAWLTEQHRREQGEPPYDIVNYLIGSVETNTNSYSITNSNKRNETLLERAIRR